MNPRPRRHEHDGVGTRLVSAAVVVAVLTCLLATGCASRRGEKSSGYAPERLTALRDSIEPLRQQFNADKDKLRVLALFSPT